MRRKLLVVNLALVALTAVGLWRLRVENRRAGERYRILNTPPTGAAKAGPESAAPGPVQPAGYFDAADKYLFSQDRNPTVVVDPPKVKPRPKLPQLYGVMNVGGGPIALMSAEAGARHKPIRVGEKIGEFQLVSVSSEQITLDWEGETIHAPVGDLLARPSSEGRSEPAAASSSAAAGGSSGATVLNPGAGSRPGEYVIGPAQQTSTGVIYQSPPGDTAPHGTVQQGKRKVVRQTLFGTQSWWEEIKD